MKNRNIFIIATQHHLIQFRRAILHFRITNDNISLLIFTNDATTSWIENIHNEFPTIEIQCFENWVFRDLFFGRTRMLRFKSYLRKLKTIYPNNYLFSSQYSNDYSLLATRILEPNEVFILDEGTASFMVANKRMVEERVDPKLAVKSLLYTQKLLFPNSITYFTQYNIPLTRNEDRIIKYSFDIIDNDLTIDNKSAILLGTSLVELGLIDENIYLKIIEDIMNEFKGKTISYYAHRKENKKKMNKIRSIGFVVVENIKPFEFLFPELFNKMPSVICSFASPILDTLSKQYKNIPEFRLYRIPSSYYRGKNNIENMLFDSFVLNPLLDIVDLNYN